MFKATLHKRVNKFNVFSKKISQVLGSLEPTLNSPELPALPVDSSDPTDGFRCLRSIIGVELSLLPVDWLSTSSDSTSYTAPRPMQRYTILPLVPSHQTAEWNHLKSTLIPKSVRTLKTQLLSYHSFLALLVMHYFVSLKLILVEVVSWMEIQLLKQNILFVTSVIRYLVDLG